ncbi:MAG: hypothetical protein R3F39_08580 [Myxococcota bacterium]
MNHVKRHALLAGLALVTAAGLGLEPDDARGGFVSSALVGVLDTAVPASQLTVTFRAVDQSGKLVWEADPADVQAAPLSGAKLEFKSTVPSEITARRDVELVMWIYAVKARGSVSPSSLKLEGRSGLATETTVAPKELKGLIGEVIAVPK